MLHHLKTFFLTVLSFSISVACYGQVKLGIKAGGGISGIHQHPDLFTSHSGPAYHIGAFTQVTRYRSKFFVRPELLYSVRRFYMNGPGFNQLITLNYFSLPIMFGFKPHKKLALLAGVELGFMTGFSTPFANNYRTNDIALNAGISYDLTYNLGIELRCGAGLLSLMEVTKTDENGIQTTTKSGYNNALQLSISYNFAKEGLSDIAPVLRKKKQ